MSPRQRPRNYPRDAKPELSVVLRSGTPQEQERPAQLLAFDEDEIRDLAVLEVKQVPEPAPADPRRPDQPGGRLLRDHAGRTRSGSRSADMIQQVAGNRQENPAITVTQMSISSLRRDEAQSVWPGSSSTAR